MAVKSTGQFSFVEAVVPQMAGGSGRLELSRVVSVSLDDLAGTASEQPISPERAELELAIRAQVARLPI